jgi:ketosteroid isomerase-like protein
MIEPSNKAQVANRLVEAIARGDADAMSDIFTADATIWHSTDQIEMSLPELQNMLRAISSIATAEVAETGLRETSDGFVLTLKSTYQLKSGESTTFHAAQVVQLSPDGKITRVDEYLDNAGLDPLIRALSVDSPA